MYEWLIMSLKFQSDRFCSFQICIERMLNLTDHLRRLKVDKYEYVAMKVIVLLSSGNLNATMS